MSALAQIADEQKDSLEKLLAVVATTKRAQDDADDAAARAQAAADEANRAEQDLAARKRDGQDCGINAERFRKVDGL